MLPLNFRSLQFFGAVRAAAVWVTLVIETALGVEDSQKQISFVDVTEQSGIDFVHCDGGRGKHYNVETVASGLATFDYDLDGLTDIYFLTGAFPEPDALENPNKLYRNLGKMTFVDVTDRAGIGDLAHSLGVTVADYDNDGIPDVFVNNFGENKLYRNNGDGTFTRVPDGPTTGEKRVGAGASFLDIEGDGDLDLYIGNYIKFDYSKPINRLILGVPASPGPKDFEPDPDQLFRNNGDGSFTDISVAAGISSSAGASMGMISFDFDKDGDSDIFVANDSMENFLWQNDGKGQFEEVGLIAGVAYDFAGVGQASMGVECGDINGDGWLDLVSTNFENEVCNAYINSGKGHFDDMGPAVGLGLATREVKWGLCLEDFNHDTFLDLFIATGHLIDTVSKIDSTNAFATKNRMFLGNANGKFSDVSEHSGKGMQIKKVSRGSAAEDFDLDGDLDLVVLNLNSSPTLLRNDLLPSQAVDIVLVGTHTNRDAVGSQVILRHKEQRWVREVHAGRSYQSYFGKRLHFALPPSISRDDLSVEIHWHGGKVQVVDGKTLSGLVVVVQPSVE